jgi:hypothetical protein
MIRYLWSSIFMLLGLSFAFSQDQQLVLRAEPTNWWVGMKNPNVQVLIYGDSIVKYNVKCPKRV